jgi:hypothetical protein
MVTIAAAIARCLLARCRFMLIPPSVGLGVVTLPITGRAHRGLWYHRAP